MAALAWTGRTAGVPVALAVGLAATALTAWTVFVADRRARRHAQDQWRVQLEAALPGLYASRPDSNPDWAALAQAWSDHRAHEADGREALEARALLEGATLPMFMLRSDGALGWRNAAYDRCLGETASARPELQVARVLAPGQSLTRPVSARERVFEVVANRPKAAALSGGVGLVSLGVMLDVTERVQVEQEIQSIVGAAEVGNFDGRVTMAPGEAQDSLGAGVNRLLETISKRIAELCTVMEGLSVGDLTRGIEVDYQSGAEKLTGQFRARIGGPYRIEPPGAGEARTRLYSADALLNDNFEVVDRFTAVTGSVATVFVREDQEFYRITTSVRTDKGERAIGTRLDHAHQAYGRLLRGERYVGAAELFGKRYMTCYDPIQNSTGDIVGIIFVGFDMGAEHNLFVRLRDEVERTCTNLTRMLAEMQGASAAVDGAASEIAAGNSDLAARTEGQSGRVEETLRSMGALADDTRSNAAKADEAHQVALEASRRAEEGGRRADEVRATMDAIHASSRKIAEITGVIDGLAFQTNLLALNAAVEAARAGTEGRGFAVVATEVRQLAQRSAEAARDIKALIGAAVTHIDTGTRVASQAGEVMKETGTVIGRVTALTADISVASARQRAGIEAVNEAMAAVGQAVEQNAALVEEASAATESLKEQALALRQQTERFVIRTDAAGDTPVSLEPRKARAG